MKEPAHDQTWPTIQAAALSVHGGPQVATSPKSDGRVPQLVPLKLWQSASDEQAGAHMLVVAFQTTQ